MDFHSYTFGSPWHTYRISMVISHVISMAIRHGSPWQLQLSPWQLQASKYVAITESPWQLQNLHGNYRISMVITGSPWQLQDLHGNYRISMAITGSPWQLRGRCGAYWKVYSPKKNRVNNFHSIYGVKKFHSLRSEFHSILTLVE